VGGGNDAIWPSAQFAAAIARRLTAREIEDALGFGGEPSAVRPEK
jgi:hypothetical protein